MPYIEGHELSAPTESVMRAHVLDTTSTVREAVEIVARGQVTDEVVAGLGGTGPVATALDNALYARGVARAEGSPGVRLVVGAIRNYGAPDYWGLIQDAAHGPVGISSVETGDDRVTLVSSTPKRSIAGGTLLAVADETLAKNGYFVGGSGGGANTVLQFGRAKTISDRLEWTGSAWVNQNGKFSVESWANGLLTLTHEPMIGQTAGHVTMQQDYRHTQFHATISAQSTAQTVIAFKSATGADVTTANTNLRFYVSRSDNVGMGDVNPKDITLNNSNVWFMLAQTYK